MITREEVERIAKLSKLEFSESELNDMSLSLNKILNHVEILNEVDVTDVEPLYSVNEIVDVTREDKVENTINKKDFLNNSPEHDDEFIILPKIVEGK